MKTAELTGAALDWAVAKALGEFEVVVKIGPRATSPAMVLDGPHGPVDMRSGEYFRPSDVWSQGGPIIEREGICLRAVRTAGHAFDNEWLAMPAQFSGTGETVFWTKFRWVSGSKQIRARWQGSTALVAAMRCYVASKLGDDIEVPKELQS